MNHAHRQRQLAGFDDSAADQELLGQSADALIPAETVDDADEGPFEQPPRQPAGPPPDLAGKTVWVVDAHSLIYQVFHALPEMSSPTGQPVAAVHGFIRDLLELLLNKQPDYLFCAFDHSAVTFRHSLYEQYKIARQEMPLDLRPQIQSIRRMLEAMAIPVVELPNYEADDVMATIACRTEELGGDCFLVSGDKDCRQLITDHVKVYNIRKDLIFDAEALLADWGVRPDQVIDFQAMVGDSVDNIPGIPLIGPKLARELLQQYGTLENVLAHAEQVAGQKRRENLIASREQALLSRDLVRLDCATPVAIDWEAGQVGGINHQQVQQLCREFGFRRLAEQFNQLTATQASSEWTSDYRVVSHRDELASLARELATERRVAMAVYTTRGNPRWAAILGIALAYREDEGYYVPLLAAAVEQPLDLAVALEILRPVLENPAIEKVGHNLQADMIALRTQGVRLKGWALDTTIGDYLLNPGERNHEFDDLARRYLNHTTTKLSDLTGTGKKQKRLEELPVDQMATYAAEGAEVALRAARLLEERLAADGLQSLYRDLEMPLLEVLAELQYNGIRVDVDQLRSLGAQLGDKMQQLEAEIYTLAGGPFSIDSRLQLSKVLFDQLGLPVIKKTKTGPSTDAEVLAELAKSHPLPAKLLEYRHYGKLKSTYIDALPALVYSQTGRVHTSFKQDVAATGRLSSQDPNLQNIPIRSEVGRQIRAAFIPGEADWQLLAADYSQIELRVLAHFSGDQALQEAFQADHDIHALVAAEIHGVPLEHVTAEMRRRAKTVNFGVIYGLSPFGLSKALEIDKSEAATFIDAYFQHYQGVNQFIEQTLDECRRKGYVSTILGRRRAVQGIRDSSRRSDSRQRNLPERIAVNTVIQGSAADLIKKAMIQVRNRLQREGLQARMLLQIHDELLFEVPRAERALLARLVNQEMTGVGQLAVPLKVDVKIGSNWAECEPWVDQ